MLFAFLKAYFRYLFLFLMYIIAKEHKYKMPAIF